MFASRVLRLLGLALVTGCFSPTYDVSDGELLCDEGECPPGFRCFEERCWRSSPPPAADASVGDAAQPVDAVEPVDAASPEPDAPPEPDAASPPDAATPPDGAVCVEGEKRCADLVPEVCDQGTWQAGAPCALDCVDGACVSECTDGARDCVDATPRECISGAWMAEAVCPFVCSGAGECTGTCVPTDTKCEAGVPSTCDASGTWVAGPPCELACDGDVCGGSCVPGSDRCNGDDRQHCGDDGEWDYVETCELGCTGSACNACQPDDETLCQGKCGTIANNCDQSVNCEGVDGGVTCVAPQTCGGGGNANQCGCASQPTATTCAGKCGAVEDNCGLEVACSAQNGGVSCADPSLCGAGSAPDNTCCVPEGMSAICDGKCGTLSNNCQQGVECGDDCAGEGPQYTCGGALPNECGCDPGAKRCEADVPQTCDASGAWVSGTACSLVCSQGECQACVTGEEQCSGSTTYQECQANGTWGSDVSCPPQTECWGPGNCTECTPDETSCASTTQPQTCDEAGSWENETACSNQTCVNGACQGVCVAGTRDCVSTTSYRVCNKFGAWSTTNLTCTDQACVDPGGVCTGVCSPGSRRCNGAQPQLCSASGAWANSGAICTYGCSGAGVCCASPCTGDGGAPCSTTVTSCGVMTSCSATCDSGLTCGQFVANQCGCMPNDIHCAGKFIRQCNAAGSAVTILEFCGTQMCCECDGGDVACFESCDDPACNSD